MPSAMKARRRPPSGARLAYKGRRPTTCSPSRATRTNGSLPAENHFHQAELHAQERNPAPGCASSASSTQMDASRSRSPRWTVISSGAVSSGSDWALRMPNDLFHGMCHEIDGVVVEGLMARQLEDLAAELGHFGEPGEVAGGVTGAPEVDGVDAARVQLLHDGALVAVADAHGHEQRAGAGQKRRVDDGAEAGG